MNAEGRAEVKERYPDAKVTDIAKYCGQTWHQMTAQEKVGEACCCLTLLRCCPYDALGRHLHNTE